MVGKTPQVREIVYNVLDDTGARSVIAKGATTVDVGDTQELFTRTTALESLTSSTFSNVANVQNNIEIIEYNLSSIGVPTYSSILLTLEDDHVSNVARIATLEDVHASNSIVVSANFSNIIDLQSNLESNAVLLSQLIIDHVSNVANINGNFSNISILQGETTNNFSNITALQTAFIGVTQFENLETLQTDVTSLKDRITLSKITIGSGAGTFANGKAISIGEQAGSYIGTNSIGIGAGAQFNQNEQQRTNTKKSIVINATGLSLTAPRLETLVIRPIQTDDSNTINIMGYSEIYGEIVQSTLLRGIDGNVHATSNIIVNDDAIVFETNGNGSFGGIVEISSKLEVGGSSSFTGAMQVDDTLEIEGTSTFVGEMTVQDSVNVHGQSFIVYNGATAKRIILTNEGTGSFLGAMQMASTLHVGGTSSFTGAMQMASTLEVGGTSSFTGDVTLGTGADLIMNVSSFKMKDVGGTETIKITSESGSASFAGNLNVNTIDCRDNIDIYNSFNMRDSEEEIFATINNLGVSSFAGAMQIKDTLIVQENSSFVGGIVVPSTSSFGGAVTVNSTSTFTSDVTLGNGADLIMNVSSFKMKDVGGTETIKITSESGTGTTAGSASFAGNINVNTIDCRDNIDIYNSFNMRDSEEEIFATINNLGVSSFAGAMQIKDTLIVQENSSFVGGIVVPSTSSFGGAVTVNSTSTFTSDVTLGNGADLIMNVSSFKMKDVGGTETIKITSESGTGTTAGSASFAGNINVNTIDCRDNIDIYNIFNMRTDGETINATINNLGVSSFYGKMQIENALDVDGIVKISHDGSKRIQLTPGSSLTDSIVTIFGDLELGSGKADGTFTNKRVSISQDGTGNFSSTVTAGGFNTAGAIAGATIATPPIQKFSINADGNASFAGTMQVAGATELNDSLTIKDGNTTVKASISADGVSSFAGAMQMASTLTVGSTSSFASGMHVSGTSGTTCLTAVGDIEGADFIIPSDRRFKTEITHIPNALDKIKQISGCTYKVGDKPSAGVIAQEILKVLPEVVHTREDGYYAVSYHGLIGLLIEAVKELSEKVK